MPLLFSLGQNRALLAVNARLIDGESLFAFHDDLYVLCLPERVGEVHRVIQHELWSRANIRVHHGKTKVWSRAGAEPRGCEELTVAARMVKESATVWVGDHSLPSAAQGMRVLGSPIGHPDFVRSFLEQRSAEHSVLLQRIPVIPNLQLAWLLLLYCAAPRSNFWLRTVPPDLVEAFATAHDVGLWQCLCAIMNVDGDMMSASTKETATFPLSMGGLGLRSAFRLRQAAHWSSWGDCLEMIRDRCFQGWGMLMDRLTSTQQEQPHSIAAATESVRRLEKERPELPPMEDGDIYQPKHGWQHLASRCTDTSYVFTRVAPSLSEADRAMLRSQGDALVACPFTCASVSTPTVPNPVVAPIASPSPLQQRHADVAVSMTCLATTGLHALSREC